MPALLLEDGVSFKGYWISAPCEAVGEVVVHTGMTGYQEILTDPASFGQIIVMTYPLIGNYGIHPQVSESSRIHARGMVMQEACLAPSHWKARGTLGGYLDQEGCAGLYGLDTRSVVRHIRKHGVMRGIVTDDPGKAALEKARGFTLGNPIPAVTCEAPFEIAGNGWHVAVLDLGAKKSVVGALEHMGCRVQVFPAHTHPDAILKDDPDGILIAGGPGDPAAQPALVETVERLLGARPLLGVGLGCMMLALAAGGKTQRMAFGHRGSSYPVMREGTPRGIITTQNHGYDIAGASLPPSVEVTHTNGQDGSVEGISLPGREAFGVAFDPSAQANPHEDDTYERFFNAMQHHRLTVR